MKGSPEKPCLEDILLRVQKPARYIGGEWNVSPKERASVKTVLAYPDVYEIGMSNLGLQILYEIINGKEDYLAERTFAPWVDMEEIMRRKGIPLFAIESRRPLVEFDLLGFSLQYEMTYSNILNMLDLAGIPLKSKDRNGFYPLVAGGGPCTFNPEPLAAFFDFFVLGEAEELILEILDVVKRWKGRPRTVDSGQPDKEEFLENLTALEGVYVPLFYQGFPLTPVKNVPPVIRRRIVTNFSQTSPPLKPLVPLMSTIHDRCSIEIMRGCTRGCRFCQAGIIYRPVRERPREELLRASQVLLKQSGYEEISLTSLSSTDHSQIQDLARDLAAQNEGKKIAISLPSLRIDQFSLDLAQSVSKVQKRGLTFAPEAGTDRLRQVINKGVGESDLLETARSAFEAGWRRLKLYFMIGLPSETEEDLWGIICLVDKVLSLGGEILSPREQRKLKIVVSVSSFIPKPHSPFQWAAMDSLSALRQKQNYLKEKLRFKRRKVDFKWHDAALSKVEAAFARGGRELADVLITAWKLGCRFDAWSDHFNFSRWQEAFERHNYNFDEASRSFDFSEPLPWDHLHSRVEKEWLWQEYQHGLKGIPTLDCREAPCTWCGVCDGEAKLEIQNVSLPH